MVGRITKGASIRGVLEYNAGKVRNGEATVLYGNLVLGDCEQSDTFDMRRALLSFQPYLDTRKIKDPVFHVSLNPDITDCLTDAQLTEIAREYMERMGFGDQPYIVYRHNDIGREHLHVVSVRVDETGRAISDSYEHERSMAVCRELEQQFSLTPATKKEWKEGLPLSPVDYKGGNLKGQLAGVIRPLAREWHFQTLGEYRAVLSLYGITVDEVKGEYGGRAYHGLSYSATDKDGNKVGKPFKASVFGKEAGIEALEKRMQASAAWFKNHKDIASGTSARIAAAMHTAGRDRALFERELMRQGIGVVFRTNESGRIYGATFIDHADKTVFNGSRLGKEFSANVFNDLFAGQGTVTGLASQQHQPEHSHTPEWQEQRTDYRPDHKDGTARNVAAAFNLFAPVPGGASGDHPVPPQRKKRKKRKYGRQQ